MNNNLTFLLLKQQNDPNEIDSFMHQKIFNSKLKILHGGHVNAIEYTKEHFKAVKDFLLK